MVSGTGRRGHLLWTHNFLPFSVGAFPQLLPGRIELQPGGQFAIAGGDML